jgi:putative ABC transport system permease protein
MKLPLWRRHQDRELEEELQSHLRMAIRDRIDRGESPQQAEHAARREFGNVLLLRETARDMWGWVMIEQFWQDIVYAARALRKARAFTLVSVLTLALGIGANTAMFSVVQAVVLRPLPFPHPERLVSVHEIDMRASTRAPGSVSYPNFLDWRARARSFASLATHRTGSFTITGLGPSQQVPGAVVSAEFFSTLGREPSIGRGFVVGEEQPGADAIIVSDEFWRSQLGSARDAVGRQLMVNGRAYTVVGIMPPGFHFPLAFPAPQVWVSSAEDSRVETAGDTPMAAQRGAHFVQVVARLNDEATIESAQGEMETIASALAQHYPADNGNRSAGVERVLDSVVGGAKRSLAILLAAVGCVLLIACVNLANLLSARGTARHRELSLRVALGASPSRLARLLLAESVVLAAAGTLCGVLVAYWSIPLLLRYSPANLRGLNQVSIDGTVLLFATAIAAGCALLIGVFPAWRASHVRAGADLGETRTTAARPQRRILNALVIVETALGVMLLLTAGILVRGFDRLTRADPGFDASGIVTLRVNLPDSRYSYLKQIAFYDNLLPELARTPGVSAAGLVGPLPLSGSRFQLSFESPAVTASTTRPAADFAFVSPGYFDAMHIRLLRGRDFTAADNDSAPRVIVVNDSFARQYFAGVEPIGQRIKPGLATTEPEAPWRDVVGVVSDVKQKALNEAVRPMFFVPYGQGLITTPHIVMRAAGSFDAIPEIARNVIAARDPELPVYGVRRMDEYMALSTASPRFSTFLLTLFALLGLGLSAIGLYGVLAYGVIQRTPEFGVRLALGARPRDVLAGVIAGSLRLVGIGLALGLAAATIAASVVTQALDFVERPDAVAYFGVALIFIVTAFAAAYLPARRASRVDPVIALRAG